MAEFHFEKNLQHQRQAVTNTVKVFDGLEVELQKVADRLYFNPIIKQNWDKYTANIRQCRTECEIDNGGIRGGSDIIDIMMETGTGKTYTYTQTIFELNKQYGIFKFIVVVPTLSIKAGTISFLKSDSARNHFKQQYRKTLNLHIVESKKNTKSKKQTMPAAVQSFVNIGNINKNSIQVLVINAGMINSDTMQKKFDTRLFDKYSQPMAALAATQSFMIIDEPHKFKTDKKTWSNLKLMQPQFIIRYGATFTEYENLVYELNSVAAFNQNLVKGVVGHITEYDAGNKVSVKFISSDGKEATFELNENHQKQKFKCIKNSSLETIHSAMSQLTIDKINKSEVVLSTGLSMKRGDSINPYSYSSTMQEYMLTKAVTEHFKLERQLLTREVKIKPITLFFIDNIEQYRNKDGYLRTTIEKLIKAEVKTLLETETNQFYKAYLEQTLEAISNSHGGYFSKDNSEKDEVIEKEINEILHDKQKMLALDNSRRFIFSKWTLREGWDNPNVFQICKLRSSGSDVSKLQEVGRGLRLPVNEYGNRVKDEQFYLNYFVDFTETDFIDSLAAEINQKSAAISRDEVPEKLSAAMAKRICALKAITEDELFQDLIINKKVIDFSHKFLDGGFAYIKEHYPLIFDGIAKDKIINATDTKQKVKIRADKYANLKALWEKINEKVILQYKIANESKFSELLVDFFKTDFLKTEGIRSVLYKLDTSTNNAQSQREESVVYESSTVVSMHYSDFLYQMAIALHTNVKTLHQVFRNNVVDINKYLTQSNIRLAKQKFSEYLMEKSITDFCIEYQQVTSKIHPTKLTDKNGNAKSEINATGIGIDSAKEDVSSKYLFEQLFYDSALEKENIKQEIEQVLVFTKIPKNSIKIPVAGGASYSPDFAYVVQFKNRAPKLHFIIVETKNVSGVNQLRSDEQHKIKHAQKFFANTQDYDVKFVSQLQNDNMVDLITKIISNKQ